MKRLTLVVVSDVHANLPALDAVLAAIGDDYDRFVHLGDAIACGAFPAETVQRLSRVPRSLHVGNHDRLVLDPPADAPSGMPAEVWAHHRWTHGSLGRPERAIMTEWRLEESFPVEAVAVYATHYARTKEGVFASVEDTLAAENHDKLFADAAAEHGLVLHGHDHRPVDLAGTTRYVCPGSLGCCKDGPWARYAVVVVDGSELTVHHEAVPYDEDALFTALVERRVPALELLDESSYGGRLGAWASTR